MPLTEAVWPQFTMQVFEMQLEVLTQLSNIVWEQQECCKGSDSVPKGAEGSCWTTLLTGSDSYQVRCTT